MRPRHSYRKAILFVLILVVSSVAITGQQPSPTDTLLTRLTFRSIGPATMGGRIDDFAVVETQPSTFYVGAATGGVWKTTNNGTTWEPVFDKADVASIGALAVAQNNPSIVWVGSGENNNRQSSSWGGGVYKSLDGGRSWRNMGLQETRHIGRIVIDPGDPNVVYVAAMGHLWGPNKERGLFKTMDGGQTWTASLFIDDQTGVTDVVMDPSNNQVLYAATFQRQRSVWGFNGGGPGGGLYKSTDAGASWKKLTNGIPAGALGRIGIDVYRKEPRVVVALIQHERESGMYRSEDGGEHWTKVSSTNPRPMYFSQIRLDPADDHWVYVLGVRVMVSNDWGKTFNEVRVKYARGGTDRPRDDVDAHAIWIDPRDSDHLLLGSDVGVAASYDKGATWDYIDNLPIGQFYHVGYDMDTPYRVYGGLQDNDVWSGPSGVRNRFGIANHEWTTLSIGDGFVALADPRDPHNIYGETQDGNIVRMNRETNERKSIRPQPARGEPPLRWTWDTPLMLSPHDPNTLLIGANKLFRSTTRGDSWEAISPDLTSGTDRETLSLMNVAAPDIKLSKNDGVGSWPAIAAVTESPRKPGLYYVGADDGLVHVSRDGGKTWTNITARFQGLPQGAPAKRFAASSFNEGVAYAVFNNHRQDDYNPYVYATNDSGNTWTSLSATLPKGQVLNCITEDPKNADVLYLGTESALFVTLDRGQHWTRLQNNLPVVPIDEITIHPRENDMLLATHGRSIWILDDISPIQRAAEAVKTSAYLFDVRPAFEFNPSNERANYPGDRRFWGQNPDFGALISYYLAESTADVKIEIRDNVNGPVRQITSDDLKNARSGGLNRINWDLRHQPVAASAGPFVLPGQYRIVLSVDGREVGTRQLRVQGDPVSKITEADRKTQHDTALSLHELQRAEVAAATAAGAAVSELRTLQEAVKAATNAPPRLVTESDALAQRLSRVSVQFGAGRQQPGGGPPNANGPAIGNQITTLKNQIMGWSAAPTAAQLAQASEARDTLAKLVDELNDITSKGIPAFFKTMSDSGVRATPPKVIAPIRIAQ